MKKKLVVVALIAVILFLIVILLINNKLVQINNISGKSAFVPMVLVEGGIFTMGGNADNSGVIYDEEFPEHEVTISDFYMGIHEITIRQFAVFVRESGYRTDSERGFYKGADGVTYGSWGSVGKKDVFLKNLNWRCGLNETPRDSTQQNYPVVNVSWNDAQAFCKWLSAKEGKKYRLPTEAEWEYAAKGGSRSSGFIYSGSNKVEEVAWLKSNSNNDSRQVCSKKPNELGLFDMSGNVWEWCQDWYGPYTADAQVNPKGPETGSVKSVRGGSWSRLPSECRVVNRKSFLPVNRGSGLGFRVVMETK